MFNLFLTKTTTLAKLLWRVRVEFLLLLVLIPSFQDLLSPGFFPMHDDLQVFRLYQVDKCIHDGQFPCRWVPDAGFGYGYPLMEFYPPMPYYPMELMTLLGMGYFWPVKIMFALAFILSGLGMYYLAKEFFGKGGGFLSAVLYVYAPYHSVDIYVRGAMNEAWGMVWFPFVLLYIYRVITKNQSRKDVILLSTSLALQLTSHNVMTLVFAPSAIVWALFWLWRRWDLRPIKNLLISGFLGIGLAAFFFIPVVLEQKYVHVDSMTVGYFNFLAHFADLNQLFISRFWGYGGSTWGPEDGMSFSIGQIQWIAALLASAVALIIIKKNTTLSMMILMTVSFGFVYAFLSHGKSTPIWQHLELLQFAQFPWRLVALIVFFFSFASGYLSTIGIPRLLKPVLSIMAILGIVYWNMPFFHVEKHVRITIQEKFSGFQWENQVTGGIFDYLPRSAAQPPGNPAFTIPIYTKGQGGILNFRSGSNWFQFEANSSSSSSQIMLPLYTFPGLVTKVDGERVMTTPDPFLGRVMVDVGQGIHSVDVRIGYTKVRLASDLLTLLSLILLIKMIYDARRNPR
jgi:hypothetical protein